MAKIIGIDLGTTNSVVSVMEGGVAKVIANQEGANTTPSIVAFTKDGERIVGAAAKRQAVTNPENTIFSAKRFIGKRYADLSEADKKAVPYKLVSAANGDVSIEINGKPFAPSQISAAVLQKLKTAAEAYLGEKVTEAVVTVPAYFNDAQRQATKAAGEIAGLNVKRIINEPTAAALAYGMDKKAHETIAVFDFGGGTFDVSVLEVGDGVVEVKATNGDTNLGGDHIDEVLINYLAQEFKKDKNIDLMRDKMALQRLKEAAEKAKIELSSTTETEINLPYITADASGPQHLVTKISRAKLESLCSALFDKLFEPCKLALADAKVSASDIDEVILVGGSTRIPKVQDMVAKFFGKAPNKSVNPDEVVSVGAAIQGGVLAGDVTDVLLLDVTPLTLGIEVQHGVVAPIIERNTTIPTKKSQIFSTAENNQTAVEIHVVQGERKFARDNKTLGRFQLEGINPAPKGQPQIEVVFDIDANGIVNVSAIDKGTGKEQRISITNAAGISQDEVERMVKEAQLHEEEDKKRKEIVDKRNELDSLILNIERTIEDNNHAFSDADKEMAKNAVTQAQDFMKKNSEVSSEYDDAIAQLSGVSQKVTELMIEEMRKQKAQGGDQSEHETGPIDTDAETK